MAYYIIIIGLSLVFLIALCVASLVILSMIKPNLVDRWLDKIEGKNK